MVEARDLWEARNEIAAIEHEKHSLISEDELMVALHNTRVENRDGEVKSKEKSNSQHSYFNKQDREDLMMLSGVTQGLQNLIDKWEELGKPSELMRDIRAAKTWAYKGMEYLLDGTTMKEKLAVLRDVGYHEIALIEYKVERRKA